MVLGYQTTQIVPFGIPVTPTSEVLLSLYNPVTCETLEQPLTVELCAGGWRAEISTVGYDCGTYVGIITIDGVNVLTLDAIINCPPCD